MKIQYAPQNLGSLSDMRSSLRSLTHGLHLFLKNKRWIEKNSLDIDILKMVKTVIVIG